MNWFDNAVVYHIYPLGYCGCPHDNPFSGGAPVPSPVSRIAEQIPVIKEQGFNTIFFGPVFESSHHGYDTADYLTIDRRLGTNEDFAELCRKIHDAGLKVILDGVFNHVGREFWAFRDVREKKFGSRYKDWFHIREGNSGDNDGFFYEGWEGFYDLVKLNLYNGEVKDHLKSAVSKWVELFGIDGLRLDVAYCLDLNFLKELHNHCKGIRGDFWLMGETLHGDYNKWMNPEMLDSTTNYECYKGIYSSFNDMNMFEIAHSLNRQFGGENWCLYRGKKLYTFVDNHDVSRIASIVKYKEHLPGIYTLLFTMPGIPGVYYGSEYGVQGMKQKGSDDVLRPEFHVGDYTKAGTSALTLQISKLTRAHAALRPLYDGTYRQVELRNRQFAFARQAENETVYVLINTDGEAADFNLQGSGVYTDWLSGRKVDISGRIPVDAYGSMVLYVDNGSYTTNKTQELTYEQPKGTTVAAAVPAVSFDTKSTPQSEQNGAAGKETAEKISGLEAEVNRLALKERELTDSLAAANAENVRLSEEIAKQKTELYRKIEEKLKDIFGT
ncbi:hypothetical protein FACS189499_00620 [Clostridia bacterium]|nr:hypothetical protein FACS189499_00620 [Clostridia bacterium]